MIKDQLLKYFKNKIREAMKESDDINIDSFNDVLFSYARELFGKENVEMEDGKVK